MLTATGPIWPWYLVVLISILSMSWGGPLFALLTTPPSILKACWRLTLTSLFMIPGLVMDVRAADVALIERWKDNMVPLLATGIALAFHFALFSYALDHTSFSHAMLIVAVTPILIVMWHGCLWGVYVVIRAASATHPAPDDGAQLHDDTQASIDMSSVAGEAPAAAAADAAPAAQTADKPVLQLLSRIAGSDGAPLPPTWQECLGCAIGFVGVAYLVQAREVEAVATSALIRAYSFEGDVASFGSAVCVGAYLVVGGRYRKWMPLWMYALPVTASSAVFSGAMSLMLEPVVMDAMNDYSILGWLGDPRSFGIIAAIAFGPGVLGHTLANMAMKRVHALTISVCQLAQPGLAGVYGWLVGVQGTPAPSVLAGGIVILLGIAVVVTGGRTSPVHAYLTAQLSRACACWRAR